MSKLCEGVCLIHELRKRRRTEELFYSRHNGANIYQSGGSYLIGLLRLKSHSFFYNSLHSGKAYSELILKKLADGTDTTVAEMVYVIRCAYAVRNAVEVVDRSHYIINYDMLRNKVVATSRKLLGKCILIIAALFEHFLKHGKAYLLVNADILKLSLCEHGNILTDVNHTV